MCLSGIWMISIFILMKILIKSSYAVREPVLEIKWWYTLQTVTKTPYVWLLVPFQSSGSVSKVEHPKYMYHNLSKYPGNNHQQDCTLLPSAVSTAACKTCIDPVLSLEFNNLYVLYCYLNYVSFMTKTPPRMVYVNKYNDYMNAITLNLIYCMYFVNLNRIYCFMCFYDVVGSEVECLKCSPLTVQN